MMERLLTMSKNKDKKTNKNVQVTGAKNLNQEVTSQLHTET